MRQDGAPEVMKRSMWTAPAVERAAATLLASLPATYRPAVDFQLLTRESGSVRHDLPIWVSTPHVIRWSDAYGPVQRHDVPGVQGAFVLSNVLAVDECEQILRLSEAMGYAPDANPDPNPHPNPHLHPHLHPHHHPHPNHNPDPNPNPGPNPDQVHGGRARLARP